LVEKNVRVVFIDDHHNDDVVVDNTCTMFSYQ
jgi:hypothetical protein